MRRWWTILGMPIRIALLVVVVGSMLTVLPAGPFPVVEVVADDDDGGDDGDGGGDDDEVQENSGGGSQNQGDDDGDDDGVDDGGDGGDDEQAPVLITVQADTSPPPTPRSLAAGTATARAEASTGTLQVNVLLCPGAADDVTDWAAECAEPVADARFDIEAKDGLLDGWHRDLDADATGVVRVDELPVGRYGLDQIDSDWCHAESDDVDENGDLLIKDGATTTVWIYDCATATPK